MHQFLNKFSRSAALLTSLNVSSAGKNFLRAIHLGHGKKSISQTSAQAAIIPRKVMPIPPIAPARNGLAATCSAQNFLSLLTPSPCQKLDSKSGSPSWRSLNPTLYCGGGDSVLKPRCQSHFCGAQKPSCEHPSSAAQHGCRPSRHQSGTTPRKSGLDSIHAQYLWLARDGMADAHRRSDGGIQWSYRNASQIPAERELALRSSNREVVSWKLL